MRRVPHDVHSDARQQDLQPDGAVCSHSVEGRVIEWCQKIDNITVTVA